MSPQCDVLMAGKHCGFLHVREEKTQSGTEKSDGNLHENFKSKSIFQTETSSGSVLIRRNSGLQTQNAELQMQINFPRLWRKVSNRDSRANFAEY